jgi:cellulose biosynthesis protein BcsQ
MEGIEEGSSSREQALANLMLPANPSPKCFVEPLPHLKSYVLWNNKGGVGKTTLCFQLSTLYASLHPEETVVVLDLCPQANLSVMMMGGADPEQGSQGHVAVEDAVEQDHVVANSRTIFQYFHRVVSRGFDNPNPVAVDIEPFLTTPSAVNGYIPSNMRLLLGSQNLSTIDSRLTLNAHMHSTNLSQQECWRMVHLSLRDSLIALQQKLSVGKADPTKLCVFIDTNPSFATYTAIGVVAADSIIIPLKADHSSRIGMQHMMELIYGPSNIRISFAQQASSNQLPLPRVRLVVANQNTVYGRAPAIAFAAMKSIAEKTLWNAYQQPDWNPIFAPLPTVPVDIPTFNEAFFFLLRDLNTNAVLTANIGCPLFMLRSNGSEQTVGGKVAKVQVPQLQEANDELLRIANQL